MSRLFTIYGIQDPINKETGILVGKAAARHA